MRGVHVERQRVAHHRIRAVEDGVEQPDQQAAERDQREAALERLAAGASGTKPMDGGSRVHRGGMEVQQVPAVEPRVTPPPGQPALPRVDGLRAVAACSVLVTHTAFLSGFNGHGFLGEITARLDVGRRAVLRDLGLPALPAVRGRALPRRRPRPAPARYLRRRAAADRPGLLARADRAGDLARPASSSTDHWWIYYGFMQDLHVTWPGGITAAWSLCVEMQFYLLLPIFALPDVAAAARPRGRPADARRDRGPGCCSARAPAGARAPSRTRRRTRCPRRSAARSSGSRSGWRWRCSARAGTTRRPRSARRRCARRAVAAGLLGDRRGVAGAVTQIGMPMLDVTHYTIARLGPRARPVRVHRGRLRAADHARRRGRRRSARSGC